VILLLKSCLICKYNRTRTHPNQRVTYQQANKTWLHSLCHVMRVSQLKRGVALLP